MTVFRGIFILFVVGATSLQAEEAAPPVSADWLTRMGEIFQRGGPVMYVLLLLSILGLGVAFERIGALRRRRHMPRGLVDDVEELIGREGRKGARAFLRGKDAGLARVLDAILARQGATRIEQERVLEDEAGRVLWDMRLLIRPVGIVASVAPLIGLLGTVFGLISAFQQAAELGMDDPRKFASGIYEALYTTAFGLTVAIPFLMIYHYLRGKADGLIREVEDASIRFLVESPLLSEEVRHRSRSSDILPTEVEERPSACFGIPVPVLQGE